MSVFQEEFEFDHRLRESNRVKRRWMGRCPVIVELDHRYVNAAPPMPALDKKKYLVPFATTLAQFTTVIRTRMGLDPSRALFIYVGGTHLVPLSRTLASLYEEHMDPDGFLYVRYGSEATFG